MNRHYEYLSLEAVTVRLKEFFLPESLVTIARQTLIEMQHKYSSNGKWAVLDHYKIELRKKYLRLYEEEVMYLQHHASSEGNYGFE